MRFHEIDIERFEQVMAWGRYLYWCDLHRQRFDAWMEEPHDVGQDAAGWHFIALIAQWYASLWVVVEGWVEAKFEDASIKDILSQSEYCDLLRRFRNGVYHFQPRIIESRLLGFLAEVERTVAWVELLHLEFLRFFWDFVHSIPGRENQLEARDAVTGIIGWIPTDTIETHQWNIDELCRRACEMVKSSGDGSSEASQALLDAVAQARQVAEEGALKYASWKQDLLHTAKGNQSSTIRKGDNEAPETLSE